MMRSADRCQVSLARFLGDDRGQETGRDDLDRRNGGIDPATVGHVDLVDPGKIIDPGRRKRRRAGIGADIQLEQVAAAINRNLERLGNAGERSPSQTIPEWSRAVTCCTSANVQSALVMSPE